jgi:hypothetical protein
MRENILLRGDLHTRYSMNMQLKFSIVLGLNAFGMEQAMIVR